jgi:phosphopantetheine adenylyltransferase
MYSYNVFPLGVLTIAQIEKGQKVLDEITNVIDNKNNKNELLSLSNKFFTLIPHISEKLEVIKTSEMVKEKNELLEYMRKVSNSDI